MGTGLAVALLALPPAASAAASGVGGVVLLPKGPQAARQLHRDRQVSRLVDRVLHRVERQRPDCQPKPPASPGVTDDAPGEELLNLLAPLRRPATPAELAAGQQPEPGVVYRRFVRFVEAPDGTRLVLVAARTTWPTWWFTASCVASARAVLAQDTAGVPRWMRREARRAIDLLAQAGAKAPTGTYDGISLSDRSGAVGGVPAQTVRDEGLTYTTRTRRGTTRLVGLVPDGVATVTLRYPRRQNNGSLYKPTVYPSALTVTAPVHDNVFVARIARPLAAVATQTV